MAEDDATVETPVSDPSGMVMVTDSRGAVHAVRVAAIAAFNYVPNRGVQVYLASCDTAVTIEEPAAAREFLAELGVEVAPPVAARSGELSLPDGTVASTPAARVPRMPPR